MSEWRFALFDMKTFDLVVEIPILNSPTFEIGRNGDGSFSVDIQIFNNQTGDLEFAGTNYFDPTMIAPPRAGLLIEQDEVLRFAGPILTHNYNLEQNTITLNGSTIHDIVRRRVDPHSHRFEQGSAHANWVFPQDVNIGWDQASIVKFWLNEMQGGDGGQGLVGNYMNIVTSEMQRTGVIREFEMFKYNAAYYGELIENMSDNVNGFSFIYSPRWKDSIRNSTIEWLFELLYPATGINRGLAYGLGDNCDFVSLTLDGSQIAYQVYVPGAQDGGVSSEAPVGFFSNAQYAAADYLLDFVDRNHTDIKDKSTADQYAIREQKVRLKPSIIPVIRVDSSELKNFIINDQVRLRADFGLLQLDQMFIINGYKVFPSTDKMEISLSPLINVS